MFLTPLTALRRQAMSDPLEPFEAAVLASASGASLNSSLASVSTPPGSWLAGSNRYRLDIPGQLERDVDANTIVSADAAAYVAASTVLHCLDGWAYLGRAIGAASQGDAGASVHLTYYASLRAALAILASSGVAILNRSHFVVDASGVASPLPRRTNPDNGRDTVRRGTHDIAWLALQFWATQHPESSGISDLITSGNTTLTDWLGQAGTSGSLLAAEWLKAWGADLQRLAKDQRIRNQSSYNPTTIETVAITDAVGHCEFLAEFWTLLEPSAAPFETLDSHLIHQGLERAIHANRWMGLREWRRNVRSVGATLGASSPSLIRLLERSATTNQPRILWYAQQEPSSNGITHLEMISRATLLLRLATGRAAELRSKAGLSGTDLEFWAHPLLRARALFDAPPSPTTTDLWDPIRDALMDVRNWLAAPVTHSLEYLHRDQGAAVLALAGAERVPCWGLAL